MDTSRLPFCRALRKAGFRPDDYRLPDPLIWFRLEPDGRRKIELQLWRDGGHRVSHWIGGSMNTHPTEFATVEEMHRAIEHERTRADNKNLETA